MNNKQNIYLDKVIEYLLRDTNIDYKNEKITTPYNTYNFSPLLFSSVYPPLSAYIHPPFSKYCKVTYGLTDQEIEYVWKEYKEIIKDKIKNGR